MCALQLIALCRVDKFMFIKFMEPVYYLREANIRSGVQGFRLLITEFKTSHL